MLNVKTRFFIALERFFGLVPRRKVNKTILNKTFFLFKGTFKEVADYDDAWLLALAHEAKNVYDVGCNIGQASLLLLLPGRVENIVLVDPNPSALTICAENLIFNGLSYKGRFVCAFASSEAGKMVDFFTVGTGAAGSMFKNHAVTAKDVGSSLKVNTITLDSLYYQYGILPDLVKIDVEGAESLVLNGAREIAIKHKTRFFVEMHSPAEMPMEDNAIKIMAWCEATGYRPWYLKEKIILDEPRQIAKRGRCHLLLLPVEMPFPVYLKSLEQGDPLEKVPKVLKALTI
jgi:FkbM family methyltransferase